MQVFRGMGVNVTSYQTDDPRAQNPVGAEVFGGRRCSQDEG